MLGGIVKNKICCHPKCEKKAKKRFALTTKNANTSTIRVWRFCTVQHLNVFIEVVKKHNAKGEYA